MGWDDVEAELAAATEEAFAVSVTYTSVVAGAYNTTTGIRAASSTSATTVLAERGRSITTSVGDANRRVEECDWTIRVASLTPTPKSGDTITRAGLIHTVTAVARSNDGLAWKLRTRRSVD